LIPVHIIDAVTTTRDMPAGPVAIGAAVAIDRSHTAISVAGMLPDGTPMVELICHRPGTSWAAAELDRLARAERAPIVLDVRGPSSSLADELTLGCVNIDSATLSDYGAACGQLWDRMHTDPPSVLLREHPALTAAMAGAAWRHVGDTRVWGRRTATPVAALESATLALWGLHHRPAPPTVPLIFTGSEGTQ